MLDVVSCAPFIEWTSKLWSSVCSDANQYAVVYEPFVKVVVLAFLGIGATIRHPEYLSMPIR